MWRWALAAGAATYALGRAREAARAEEMVARLVRSAPESTTTRCVDFATFDALPAPVARYLRLALTDGQPFIRVARLRQSGVLRTGVETSRWLPFTARQWIVPPAVGFVWDARVAMPLATHVRVLDSYVQKAGEGHVSLLSALPVAAQAGVSELDSGALHRYLAEAVWVPSALLPESGVVWSAIDDRSAKASFTDANTTVTLEFRFNEAGEVTGIYTPRRFGRFDGEYREAAWEGRFSGYMPRSGMRVPSYGEVGWYGDDGALQLVWKGNTLDADYDFTA
jgi:hypothetical protein